MTSDWTVILVRHGAATSTNECPERPLTIAGRQHAERMASWLAAADVKVNSVLHSGKLRARQTAKVFAARIGIHAGEVREVAGLKPGDDPIPVADTIEADRRSVMVVGHLPFLARLASAMLVGDPSLLQMRFEDAGLVIMTRGRAGWQIEALVGHRMI
jgi:phosphohistidine phosphatase